MVDLPIQVMQHEAPTKHETLKLAQRKQIRSEKIHRRERNEELDSECRKKEFEERRLSETQNRKQLLLPKDRGIETDLTR